jgi:hypothetical protein
MAAALAVSGRQAGTSCADSSGSPAQGYLVASGSQDDELDLQLGQPAARVLYHRSNTIERLRQQEQRPCAAAVGRAVNQCQHTCMLQQWASLYLAACRTHVSSSCKRVTAGAAAQPLVCAHTGI